MINRENDKKGGFEWIFDWFGSNRPQPFLFEKGEREIPITAKISISERLAFDI